MFKNLNSFIKKKRLTLSSKERNIYVTNQSFVFLRETYLSAYGRLLAYADDGISRLSVLYDNNDEGRRKGNLSVKLIETC